MSNSAQKKFKSNLKYVYADNDTLSIIFQNNENLLGVVGEFNNNLKELEKLTKTNIYSRGNSILVKSTPKNNEIVMLSDILGLVNLVGMLGPSIC